MSESSSQASTANKLIDQLHELRQTNILDNDKSRKAALALARNLVTELDDPLNVTTDMMFSPCVATAVNIAVELDLYELISTESPNPVTTRDLSDASDADPLLISRVLRLLASINYVNQVGRDTWTATTLTKTMAQPAIMAGNRFMWDIFDRATMKLPEYLSTIYYTCPTNPTNGVIQYAFKTQYNVFEYMANAARHSLADFNFFMGNNMGARRSWLDWFPIAEKVLDGWDPDGGALLVDVGGGKGHDLVAFRAQYPHIPREALILQDLPHVVEHTMPYGEQLSDSTWAPRIIVQPQDFFTPNRCPGAKTYFLHHVLHDWSDDHALKILAHLRAAMKPGYSRLLIHDLILPDTHVSTFQATYDMMVMTFNGGVERDRGQWTELLKNAGFEDVKFWVNPEEEDADGIVEVVI